jgi:hypothetical protein
MAELKVFLKRAPRKSTNGRRNLIVSKNSGLFKVYLYFKIYSFFSFIILSTSVLIYSSVTKTPTPIDFSKSASLIFS